MIISRLPSGGGGKKSLILPDNVPVDLYSYDGKIVVKWRKPLATEVPIASYNLYWVQSDVKPTSLKDFTNKLSITYEKTEQEVVGLTDGKVYWFALESVSSEGYENASMRNVNNMNAGEPFYVMQGLNRRNVTEAYDIVEVRTSTDGRSWKRINTESAIGGIKDTGDRRVHLLAPIFLCDDLKFRYVTLSYSPTTRENSIFISKVDNYNFPGELEVSLTGLLRDNASAHMGQNVVLYAKGVMIFTLGSTMYYSKVDKKNGANAIVRMSIDPPGSNDQRRLCLCNDKIFFYYNKSSSDDGNDCRVYCSNDGTNWTNLTETESIKLKGRRILCYFKGKYIIAGEKNNNVYLYYSVDLKNFVETSNKSISGWTNGVVIHNGYLIIVNSNYLYYSEDGTYWNRMHNYSSGLNGYAGNLYAHLAYKNGILICSGSEEGTNYRTAMAMYINLNELKFDGSMKSFSNVVYTGAEVFYDDAMYFSFIQGCNTNTIVK